MTTDYAAKRRFPRIPSENAVLVRKLGQAEAEGFVKTRVVGLGGCMIVSDEHLGQGAFLDLLISVRGRVIKTRGRVVYEIPRSRKHVEVGVEFLEIGPDDRHVIAALFEEQEQAGEGDARPAS